MSDTTYESDDSDEIFMEEMIPRYIHNEYFLLKKIGHGGYSFVYLAYSIKNKKYFAIKIQDPDYYDDAKIEASIINKLNGKNKNYFIKLHETFDLELDSEYISFCFVFELMACSAYTLIKRGKYENGLPVNIVKNIVKDLLSGIKIMHDMKLIHSDIKPENILIEGNNLYLTSIKETFEKINIDAEYKKILIDNKRNKVKNNDREIIYEKIATNIFNKLNNITNKNKSNNSTNIDNDSDDNFIERNLISSSESDESENSENDTHNDDENINTYDENILNNIKSKITDFGGAFFIDKKPNHPVHTRYYRSPESILKYGFDEKTDIWAIGCLMYELLTGDTLFDPKRKKKYGISRSHIYEMQRTLGQIPNYLILSSKKYDIFFRNDGTQKGITKFIPNLLFDKLNDKLKNNYNNETITKCYDLIKKMLEYDPKIRISSNDALLDSFFNEENHCPDST